MTADGALGIEAKAFIRPLAEKRVWHKLNSEVLGCAYCKVALCCPSCYKFVHSWLQSEMEEKDGD